MPGPDPIRFAFVVEGHGEVEALPLLIRRICNELCQTFLIATSKPVRIARTGVLRAGGLERAVGLARLNGGANCRIVVMLDADDDCPATLGPVLRERFPPDASEISIVIANREFESWFLAAAGSIAGLRGLNETLVPPAVPEDIRGAKEWLSRNMIPGRSYSPVIDQAALVASMDLNTARLAPSFTRLVREVSRLLDL